MINLTTVSKIYPAFEKESISQSISSIIFPIISPIFAWTLNAYNSAFNTFLVSFWG
jgi:hypothetical protein